MKRIRQMLRMPTKTLEIKQSIPNKNALIKEVNELDIKIRVSQECLDFDKKVAKNFIVPLPIAMALLENHFYTYPVQAIFLGIPVYALQAYILTGQKRDINKLNKKKELMLDEIKSLEEKNTENNLKASLKNIELCS